MPAIKMLTVVGARPQFIKMSAVSRAVRERNGEVVERIVHTGQHYDERMSQLFFDEMGIPKPDYNLGIGSASHGAQTGRMLEKIEKVMLFEKPDWCLVYGDTNSTLAGALAAAKLHIMVAHVEAGLRSFNRHMPEELNRVATDHLSDLLLCPTVTAVGNLASEGIKSDVKHVGDVMLDCALHYAEVMGQQQEEELRRVGVQRERFFLATVHRAENTDDPTRLRNLMAALDQVGRQFLPVLLPLHPRTANALANHGLELGSGIHLAEPLSYLQMIALLGACRAVLTDSGGVQKEAYFFRRPCLTLRDETEWVETVELGANMLCGANPDLILAGVEDLAKSTQVLAAPASLFGDGHASRHIVALMANPEFLRKK